MKGKKIKDLKAYLRSKSREVSKEQIEKVFYDLLYQKEQEAIKNGKKPDGIVHKVWEEDGVKYSCWEITAGGHTITTGDGGMELFNKALSNAITKTE